MNKREEVNVRRYQIDGEDGTPFGWGMFWLSDDGLFTARTDYGDYIHFWPSRYRGDDWADMRRFILSVEPSYLMGKLGQRTVYDAAATIRGIRGHILEYRRHKWWDAETARTEWDLLEEFDLDTEHSFDDWLSGTGIMDAWEFCYRDYSAGLKAFAYKLMPRLKEIIRDELAAEKLSTHPLLAAG